MGTRQLIYANPNTEYGIGNVKIGGSDVSLYWIQPSELEYYFNTQDAVLFSNKLKGAFGSLSALVDAAIALMTTAIIENKGAQSTYNINNFNENGRTLADKTQGIYFTGNNSNDSCFAQIELYISRNVYNSTDMSRDITIGGYIGYNRGTWNSTLGYWQVVNNYTKRIAKFSYSGKDVSGGIEKIRDLFAVSKATRLAPGPHNIWTSKGNWSYEITGYTPSENIMAIDVRGAVPLIESGFTHIIAFEQAIPYGGSWASGGGDIDPTDPEVDPEDPYDPIVPDDPEPDDPEPVDPDDPIIEPDLPDIGGTSVGIYKVFSPSNSQLSRIASKLWDPDAWSAIKQMFTNPMEAILGLGIVPVQPTIDGSENVYLGRYNTEVLAPKVASDYKIVNCGTVTIKKFYGSYLDYDPYTKLSLYLPYVGEVELNADEVMGKNITVKYHCNVVTGDVAAYIIVGSNVMYSGGGNFIRQLPLSQVDYTNIIQTAVSATASAITLAVAGAGAASVSGAIDASKASAVAKESAQARVSNITTNGATSLLTDVLNAKYHYNHAGKIGQGGGQLNMQKPFIIISRPNLSLPEGNDASTGSSLRLYTGYPSNKIVSLSSCHGFTQIESCRLSVPDATDEEIAELYSLLKGGVIF